MYLKKSAAHKNGFEVLVVICLWHTFPEPAQILGIKTTYSNLQGDVTSKLLTGYPNVENKIYTMYKVQH